MKKFSFILLGAAMAAVLMTTDVLARGGGGGARGGGGGARAGGGGFSGGAAARPAGGAAARPAGGAANFSPSMSRAAPAQRPAQMPAAANRPATGTIGAGAAGNGAARAPVAGAQPGQRPSQGQLNNFLNVPQQSAATRGAAPAAGQLPATGSGLQSRSVTTPGGATITAGGAGRTATTPGGATVGRAVGGVKVTGPGGNTYAKVGSVGGVRGPGGNTVAAGRGASFANGQFVGGSSWGAVNGNFNHWNAFTPGWYGGRPGAWWPGKWAVYGTAWATVGWATAGSYCGCTGEPVYYDYSQNVTYDQGNVYYGDQPVATAEQYYDDTAKLADTGQTATNNEEWLPLGVFGLISEGQTKTDKIVQLAVNKDGVVRGNYQDMLSEKVIPITGSVDKKTQRVALKLEGNNLLVVETGLYNLTNDEVPILVHFGADRQEERTLIRLKQEEGQGEAKQSG